MNAENTEEKAPEKYKLHRNKISHPPKAWIQNGYVISSNGSSNAERTAMLLHVKIRNGIKCVQAFKVSLLG